MSSAYLPELVAFVKALEQVDSLPPELEDQIEDIVCRLEKVAEAHPPLQELYESSPGLSGGERSKFVCLEEREPGLVNNKDMALQRGPAPTHSKDLLAHEFEEVKLLYADTLEKLRQNYTFRQEDEVVAFLKEHPSLHPVLQEAPDRIHEFFPDSQLFLEIYFDPELDDEYQLILGVPITLEAEKAIDQMKKLRRDWWLDQPFEARRKICIDTEFQQDSVDSVLL